MLQIFILSAVVFQLSTVVSLPCTVGALSSNVWTGIFLIKGLAWLNSAGLIIKINRVKVEDVWRKSKLLHLSIRAWQPKKRHYRSLIKACARMWRKIIRACPPKADGYFLFSRNAKHSSRQIKKHSEWDKRK